MKWVESGSFIKPKRIDTTMSKKYVYIRRNIVKQNIEVEWIEGETVPFYTYEETLISHEDYDPIAASLLETQDRTDANEDAICELSEIFDEAISALEDAICELSEEIGGEE